MAQLTHVSPRAERLKADLYLLLTALIWGSAFVAQRVAALSMGAYLFNGLRFLVGALVLLPLVWRKPRRDGWLNRRDGLGIAIAGLLLFIGISFQQVGLRYTTASNAGFITGLYVVFIPLIIAIGWTGRRLGKTRLPRPSVWLASFLAAAGLFLLSTQGHLQLAPGDKLVLVCAVLFAFHVIWIGQLVQHLDVLHVAIGQSLVCGLLSLAVAFFAEGGAFPQGFTAWWAIAYTGILSAGVGYTLQAVGQRVAPAADAAIILSMEAVFAALSGWLVLGERLSALQLLGCGLMLAAMILAQTGGERAEK